MQGHEVFAGLECVEGLLLFGELLGGVVGGLDGKTDALVLHLTESDSQRHAQQALETADLRLEQANASLDRLTFNDELTGLVNQRRFVDELEKEIARHQRSGLRFGVIAIEADHFNQLAEQHGSAFRDRSLALIARAIEVEVRDTDLCARLDGEEFAVLAVQMKILLKLLNLYHKQIKKIDFFNYLKKILV